MSVTIDDMPEPAAGVMRMSADDDDQADQQQAVLSASKNARSTVEQLCWR